MPYRRRGKSVYKYEGGKWKLVGSSSSIEKAKVYLNTLRAVHHGWKPTGKGRKK